MEQKINIAKLLKDCPKGMELYSPIFGKVYLDKIRPHLAIVVTTDKYKEEFLYDGRYGMNGECMLFPSKGKTTWEGFHRPFVEGDVVSTESGVHIGIVKSTISGDYCYTFCLINGEEKFFINDNLLFDRFATEEEKAKLFHAIKANGYKWNAETKTLEKLIEPKFKIGDRIVKRNSISNLWIVSSINSQYYGLNLLKGGESIGLLSISEQDDWELAPNIEPKFKVGDTIQDEDGYKVKITEVNLEDECYGYESMIAKGIGGISFSEQNNWELVPNKFDITTLVPFERVLVRICDTAKWFGDFYLWYDDTEKDFPYNCVGGIWSDCIPFESNEHLLGTANDCDDFYKNW